MLLVTRSDVIFFGNTSSVLTSIERFDRSKREILTRTIQFLCFFRIKFLTISILHSLQEETNNHSRRSVQINPSIVVLKKKTSKNDQGRSIVLFLDNRGTCPADTIFKRKSKKFHSKKTHARSHFIAHTFPSLKKLRTIARFRLRRGNRRNVCVYARGCVCMRERGRERKKQVERKRIKYKEKCETNVSGSSSRRSYRIFQQTYDGQGVRRSSLVGQEVYGVECTATDGENGDDTEAPSVQTPNPSCADEQHGRAGHDQGQSEAVRRALARASRQPVSDRFATMHHAASSVLDASRSRGISVVKGSQPFSLRQYLQHPVRDDGQLPSRELRLVPHSANLQFRLRKESLRGRFNGEVEERSCQSNRSG